MKKTTTTTTVTTIPVIAIPIDQLPSLLAASGSDTAVFFACTVHTLTHTVLFNRATVVLFYCLPVVVTWRRALDVFSGVCLFVCKHDNFRISKHRIYRMMKLGGRAWYKNLGRVRIWGS